MRWLKNTGWSTEQLLACINTSGYYNGPENKYFPAGSLWHGDYDFDILHKSLYCSSG